MSNQINRMVYSFFKPLAAISLRGFFKKIIFTGLNNLPKDNAVILAANHPTAFVEPCILAAYLDRPLYFLVRGDYFRKPIYNFILRVLHMLPIFRRMDGNFSDLKNNVKILDACADALASRKTIMILAEGQTKHEKRLRPIQKGTARLAFSTLHKHPNLNLVVVPVSVNFTNSLKWRSNVMIHFGEPIDVKPFYNEFAEKPAESINHFTNTLHDALKKYVVHIDEKKWDKTANKILTVLRNQLPSEHTFLSQNPHILQNELETTQKFNSLSDELKTDLKIKLKKYFKKLKNRGLDDATVKINGKLSLHLLPLVFLGFFLAIPGAILNFIPVWISKTIKDQRVSSKTYKTPVFIASLIGVHLIFFLLTIIIAILTGFFPLVLLQPISIVLGLVSVHYWDLFARFIQSTLWKGLPTEEKIQLQTERNSILSNFI